jgi:hypothetical protein
MVRISPELLVPCVRGRGQAQRFGGSALTGQGHRHAEHLVYRATDQSFAVGEAECLDVATLGFLVVAGHQRTVGEEMESQLLHER